MILILLDSLVSVLQGGCLKRGFANQEGKTAQNKTKSNLILLLVHQILLPTQIFLILMKNSESEYEFIIQGILFNVKCETAWRDRSLGISAHAAGLGLISKLRRVLYLVSIYHIKKQEHGVSWTKMSSTPKLGNPPIAFSQHTTVPQQTM